MNDPWPLLVAALAGQRTTIPPHWPARTVHRLDACVAAARAAQPDQKRASPPHARPGGPSTTTPRSA